MKTVADLARRLKGRWGLPRLVLMTDPARLPDPLAAVGRLPPGTGAVIFRNHETPDREALARRTRDACRRRGVRFLVAGDPALAIRLHADGLHLPGRLARRWAGCGPWKRPWPGFVLSAAVHDSLEMAAALRVGADLVLVSPVFPTASHPEMKALGIRGLARLARTGALPVLALGGIDAERAASLRHCPNLIGFAGISRFMPTGK